MNEPATRTRIRTRFKPVRLKLSSDHSKRPLERMSLHDQLVAKVREMIVDGELKAGAPLPERMLCETFGVSRTPLREAFKILASEGLIELKLPTYSTSWWRWMALPGCRPQRWRRTMTSKV